MIARPAPSATTDAGVAIVRNTRHLGGERGMTPVLHTRGQNLSRHVHVHCLIPGGVLTGTGDWHKAKSHYLFPVLALSRHFRGRMVSLLRAAVNAGELHSTPQIGGYPELFIAAAQTRSDTGEPGVSAMLAVPPL
nr:transposase [Marinobacter psychrophilus]